MLSPWKLTVTSVAGLALMCAASFGQSPIPATQPQTFHVRGIISDPSGAVIPKVNVAFQSEQLNKTVTTNDAGVYEADLPLGDYIMTAPVPGFRPYRRPLFRVMTPASLTFDITLPVGKQVNRVVVNSAGSRVTPEEWAAALKNPSNYYGEESFPASSEDGVPFQLYIRYTRRATAANGAYIYTHDKTPYEDPVVVAYNLFSLQADEVVYDVKTRTIKARGNVVVVDESGATQRADSMSFKIENGRAAPLR